MNCSEVQELLSAYHDGELLDEQRSRLASHLEKCSDCTKKLAGFGKLSAMVDGLDSPVPPGYMWSQIEQQLEQSCDEQAATKPVHQAPHRPYSLPRLLAIAATILVAVGLSSFTYQMWIAHSEHDQFAVEFGKYLDEFARDPDAAQQTLLANYENQIIDPGHAIRQVGYRPAVADGLPQGYTLVSTHVMEMPCCTCTQSICKRSDGSTLAIFEHNDDEITEWFSGRPDITASCSDKQCCLVQVDNQIAASWKRGTRHITLIGVRDVSEVSQMVAWLDKKSQSLSN